MDINAPLTRDHIMHVIEFVLPERSSLQTVEHVAEFQQIVHIRVPNVRNDIIQVPKILHQVSPSESSISSDCWRAQ